MTPYRASLNINRAKMANVEPAADTCLLCDAYVVGRFDVPPKDAVQNEIEWPE